MELGMKIKVIVVLLPALLIVAIGFVLRVDRENHTAGESASPDAGTLQKIEYSRNDGLLDPEEASRGYLSQESGPITDAELPEIESYYIPPKPLSIGHELSVPPDFRIARGSGMAEQIYLSPLEGRIALVDWVKDIASGRVTYRIHVSNPDTGEWEIVLTQSAEEGRLGELLWTADGSAIIYQSVDQKRQAQIYRYDVKSQSTDTIYPNLGRSAMLLGTKGEAGESLIVAVSNSDGGMTIQSITESSIEPRSLLTVETTLPSSDRIGERYLVYSSLAIRPRSSDLYFFAYEKAKTSGGGMYTKSSHLYRISLEEESPSVEEVDLGKDFSGIIDSVQWSAEGDFMGFTYRTFSTGHKLNNTRVRVVNGEGKAIIDRELDSPLAPILAISATEVIIAGTPAGVGPVRESELQNTRLATPYLIPFDNLM